MHITFVKSHPELGLVGIDPVSTWADMPEAELAIFDGSRRQPADLTQYTAVLLAVDIERPGASEATVSLHYSLDGGDTWEVATVGGADRVLIDAPGLRFGKWAPLHSRARGKVLLTIAGAGGDGEADPGFLGISAQFR